MQTNKQLELAFNFVQFTGQNIFLTGKAGTGKTTFLKNLKEKSPKRMIVVAPTGVAAINAGGVTIHSFFQLSFAPQLGDEKNQLQQMRFNREKIKIIRSLDLLVIDEISMVRADILDAVDRVLRRFKNRTKPFGGTQVLLIGDLQQLAPVVKSEEWGLLKREYETAYFFSSKVFKQTPFVNIELTHVYRQVDNRFISILNRVRDNQLKDDDYRELAKRVIPGFKPAEDDGYITLCTHNVQAERLNDAKLRELHDPVQVFTAEVEGKFPEYSYPTEFKLKLKKGAQVMFVKNDPEPEKRFFNGKIGKITDITDEAVFVNCPGEKEEIEVTPLVWENKKYTLDEKTAEIKEELEGKFIQFPLKLAWAITIHKSQGLTFEKAIIDAEASFAHGQVYVALSRCKSLEGMVLSTPISERSIINDSVVSGFTRNVELNQPDENQLLDAKNAYQKELLFDLFNFRQILFFVKLILKLADENKGSFPEIVVNAIQKMRTETNTKLLEVGEKFQVQLQSYIANNPEIAENKKLLERVEKAAVYFEENLVEIVQTPAKTIDFDLDNRAVKKQVKNLLEGLFEETETKLAGYEICKTGFDVKKLLDAKALALVGAGKPADKKQKAMEVPDMLNIPHQLLYSLLRSWRYEKAMELGVPVYLVFSQKALIEMVNYLPVDGKSLQLMNGMGSKKIEQFGAEILQIIQHYCDENSIERGTIPLKSSSKKEKRPQPDTKKVSFELFQSGKTIVEISKERELTLNTIESHLAHYVKLGKLDIKRILSTEKLDKITSYFKTAESKSFGEAKAHFGDEISYGELRMGLSYLESLELR